MGSDVHEGTEDMGHFTGTIFNNGRIVMEVGKDYAVMKDARNGEVLIERIYPEVQVREGEEWKVLDFEKETKDGYLAAHTYL